MESAKMKIALIITQGDLGGAQTFVWQFANYARSLGHEVTIFSGPGDWLMEEAAKAGVPFQRLRWTKREIHPLYDLLALFELIRIFRQKPFDAIHLNSSKIGILGSLAARLSFRKLRVAYRIGGWVFLEPLSAWKKKAYLVLEKWTARFKDIIICVHPGDQNVAEREGITPRESVVSVPNGIDLADFDARIKSRIEARAALGLGDGFIFGTQANFYPPKNIPQYLESCAAVHQVMPDASFAIIGDGAQRLLIEQRIRELGLSGVVHLLGHRPEARQYFRAFDVYVVPSVKEGMSWALLEAMAASLPCIATDVGAAAWQLGDAGLIVPPGQPAALTEAMLRIMREPELQKALAQKARLQVETRFPLDATLRGNLKALTG